MRTRSSTALLPPILLSLACGMLALSMVPAVLAAPPMNDCKAMHEDDTGERMRCNFGNISAQQEETIHMLMDMGALPPRSDSQMERLDKLMGRANRAIERTPAKDFRGQTKTNKGKCQIVEIVGDGIGDEDGICTGNELCVEDMDGGGDGDGICKTKGKKADREVCAEICDEEVFTDPRNFDDDGSDPMSLGSDLDEQLVDLTMEYVEVNEMLAVEMEVRAAAAEAVTLGPDPTECDIAISEIGMPFGRPPSALVTTMIVLAEVVNVAEQICDAAGAQDISGFNVKSSCLAPVLLAGAAQLASDLIVSHDGNIDSETMDATIGCIDELRGSIGDIDDQLKTIIMELMTVKAQLVTTIDLLNTPEGRRGDFPVR